MPYMNMSVATLVRRHPWAREVFEWYGVDLDRADPHLSISALCWLERLDAGRVERDLRASSDDAALADTPPWVAVA